MADTEDNQDIIDALKQPVQFSNKQFFPQRHEGAITDWITSQGEKVKSGLEDILKHPENLPTTGNLTGIMAGPLARTANLKNLNLAEAMWGQGNKYTPEQIHDATGWFKSGAGSPRFEIPDIGMKPKPIQAQGGMDKATTDQFIEHPELFKAYPQLKGTTVTVDPMYSHGREGMYEYSPPPFRITVGGEASKTGLERDQLKTLIHELQHNVSYQEGTEMGANPSWIGELPYAKAKGFRDLINTMPTDVTGQFKTDIARALKYSRRPNVAFEMYKRLPAETEARNVAERYIYSTSQDPRRLTYPWHTEDRPRNQQFDYSGGFLAKPYGGK